MRTIQRDIVGAFIFSKEGKMLLGHNKKGGVYQDKLVIPGGGIHAGEPPLDALKREVMEETGIDVSRAKIYPVDGVSTGESEKTIKETGERVFVQMHFYDFEIRMSEEASAIVLRFEDDYADADWYELADLDPESIGPAVRATLQRLHLI